MTEEVKIKKDVKENNEFVHLIMSIFFLLIFGSLFMIFYITMLGHIGEESQKRLQEEESRLSPEILNQCKKIAKAQERTVAAGMTVHSSYWIDYKYCLKISAIHKEQYGKEDLVN